MKYHLYRTDGTMEVLSTETKFDLNKLQELVGGNIEFAPTEPDGAKPMVNEDGLGLMLPRNPFFKPYHQAYYVGNILLGKDVETSKGTDFVGFDDDESDKFIRKPIGYDQSIFKAGKTFTMISIGDFLAQTTRNEIKATGEIYKGVPVFKENKKGVRSKFTVKKLDDPDTLFFEGTDLPFKIDGEVETLSTNGMTSRIMRGNAMINLVGDPVIIKEWVTTKNLNPYFSGLDRINLIEGEDKETLLFTDVPTTSRMVMDKREKQLKK